MSAERITVLEYELKAVRALRCSPNIPLVREALAREEELEQQIELLRSATVLPIAANFARRDADPSDAAGGSQS